ncbi:tyrosine--tRNA ligase [Enterobacteriaceae endosymbiont of Plateumaris consimilis]|uniref:tyrosine--tRNA ligase n=1 Tax=Enterobacteriaceae endosymbiont of Plateumaris consimilis TaxID=2675794 RepID=UPI001448B258|nr:tyrosine--tRNA ligase [Enterobacteriaceae endosymbiont of Plateumaris consimilis]QJC28526.1 tyrosine--tRNA ligase [Enterobacteriaceae endosymbiont of Plateumaris consimilis]
MIISKNNEKNLIKTLEYRNIINQITDKNNLKNILMEKKINLYCGFDPTADSLHIGHLIPLIILRYFQKLGHKPIILLGGATGLIGDPSFKLQERKKQPIDLMNKWISKISSQIKLFLDFNCGSNSALIVNNYDWFSKMNVLFFLKEIGKYFCVNQMMNKESIKNRINRNIQGISFTEFSYNLLQSYDFAYLNKYFNVILQIGGSDQWGHIVSGVDLVKKIYKQQVFGLTNKLITKNDGTKFGKTENKTIWLDALKTSPYDFFQFWLNVDDNLVYNFLKMFTTIKINTIENLQKSNNNSIKKNSAQNILAEHMTYLVHGKNALESAKKITDHIFHKKLNDLSKNDFNMLLINGINNIVLKNENYSLQEILILSRLAKSRSHAKNMIESNSIYINNKKKSDILYFFTEEDKIFNHFTLLRRGKKNFCLLYWK